MSLNKALLIGFVGQHPEVRYVGAAGSQNSKVAQFRLATTERYKDRDGNVKENTEWHNIVAWRGLADLAEKYISKGTQLYIEGKLKLRSWEDQNGVTRYQTDIVADKIDLLARPKDAAVEGARQMNQQARPQQSGSYTAPPSNAPAYNQPQQPQQPVVGPEDMPGDDLPFNLPPFYQNE